MQLPRVSSQEVTTIDTGLHIQTVVGMRVVSAVLKKKESASAKFLYFISSLKTVSECLKICPVHHEYTKFI